ncbi:RlmE family RNA methyltransferase [Candidatus Peribacteria bacterium]|nr:RlmE family RNA methyltransferase [Candidatus Peribacteria bacterium]
MPKPYIPNDKWSQRAAKEGYLARSVYKLMELDARYELIRPGLRVLDIGAAPGSWLQYTSDKLGPNGRVLGLDLKPIKDIAPNVTTKVVDVFDDTAVSNAIAEMSWKHVDLVLSDIAPNTSGIKDVDQWRSIELNRKIASIAQKYLRGHGSVVMKVFRGKDFDAFTHELKMQFGRLKVMSALASRDRSREVYVVCSDAIAVS